jgi:hypothetical protein
MVVDPSSVKVYTVNGPAAGASSSLPDWLIRKRASKKGKREQREHVEGTLELVQHFEFPEASNKIKTTRDGHHVIATGTYKPQMRVWDLDQLSLKFERHSDAENVDFLVSELFSHPLCHELSTLTTLRDSRFFPMTGRKHCTFKTTVPLCCITKAASTTAREYPKLVEQLPTTTPHATLSSPLPVMRFID